MEAAICGRVMAERVLESMKTLLPMFLLCHVLRGYPRPFRTLYREAVSLVFRDLQ
jgi:hypothetical protein